jgi:predicted  nucleic acid-binding Zn-ribbon protein
MNIEVLKENLSEETYSAVAEELKDKDIKLADLSTGEYVSKGKYDALETQLTNTQTLLTDTTSKLEAAIAKAGENDALKQELENLKTTSQANMDNLKNEYDAKLKTAAVMAEITKAGANDPADILPHINMDAITINDKGSVGLSEQLETIKTAKPYLFKGDKQQGASGLQHGGGDSSAELNKMRSIMGLPPIK